MRSIAITTFFLILLIALPGYTVVKGIAGKLLYSILKWNNRKTAGKKSLIQPPSIIKPLLTQ